MSEGLTEGLQPGARLRLVESILGSANDAVLVAEADPMDDSGFMVVYVNEAFTRMTGYAAGEIIGKTPRVLQGPDTDRGKLDEVRAALGRRESVRVELLNYRKDGTEFWVEMDIVPVGGQDGRPDYWLSVQRETAGRVQAESERRLRPILGQYGSDMVTVLDPDGTLIYESPQVEKVLGYRNGDPAGSNLYRYVHPDDAERLAEAVERTLRTSGFNPPVEYRIRHADGSWLCFESIGNNLAGDPEVNAIVFNTRRNQAEETLARESNLLEIVVDSVRDAIFVKDLEHRFIFSNRAHIEIHGVRSREEILGKTNADLWGEERSASHHADDRQVIETGEPIVGREEPIRDVSGEERWLSTTKAPLRGPEGEVAGVVAVSRDITERRRTEQALRENEKLLRAMTSGAPVILFALDREGVITLSEGKGLAAVGEKPGDAVGRPIFEDYGHLPEVVENVRRVLSGEDVAATVEIEDLAFEVRYSPVRGSGGEITGAIGVATYVTERRKLERELEHRAFHDPLTDLPNRALFMDRLSHALERADRRRDPVAILFMDLDGFKAVNDRFGHDEGDRVLVEVARRLRGCLRPEDTISRFVGDEFAVLLEETYHLEAGEVAERILQESRAPFILGMEARLLFPSASASLTALLPDRLRRSYCESPTARCTRRRPAARTHRHG